MLLFPGGTFAASRDFSFGLHLFEEGDYYRAITEFERYRFFEPGSKNAEGALWLVAAAYLKGEKWDLALKNFSEYRSKYPASSRAKAADFFAAESLYEARKLDMSRSAYAGLLEGEFALNSRLRLASLSLIEGQWESAAVQFSEARKLPGAFPELDRWEQLSRQGQMLRPKSPGLALLYSAVIPGSGQMASGYVQDGLSSLAMVGGFAAWAAFFFYNQQNTPGIIFSTAGGIFYLANLHGAVLAAQRSNRERPRALIKQILDEVGEKGSPEPDLKPWIK